MFDIAVAAFFAALLTVTVLHQFRLKFAWVSRMKYHDVFAVIPAWTFFAPNPGTSDHRLLWRDQLVDGSFSPWHELEAPSWSPWRGVWNAHKRTRKAVTDCSSMIHRRLSADPGNRLTLISIPYLLALHYVFALEGSPLSVSRQFLVAHTDGTTDAAGDPVTRVMFVSHRHTFAEPAPSLVGPEPEAPVPDAPTALPSPA